MTQRFVWVRIGGPLMSAVIVMSCGCLSAIPLVAQTSSARAITSAYEKFEHRAASIRAQYDTVRGADYYACAVQYRGGTATKETDANARALFAAPSGDGFWMVNAMALVLHAGSRLPASVEQAARAAWTSYAPYRGDTENHWCMYYAGLLLAAEHWPGLAGTEWFNGRSSEENRNEARSYLVHWFERVRREGLAEFDSPVYMPVTMAPLFLLHDFAQDGDMRTAAGEMLERILLAFASAQIDGMYGGAQSRATETVLLRPKRSPASGMAWLYFGTDGASRTQAEVLAALSPWRPSESVLRRALDRERPRCERVRVASRCVLRADSARVRRAVKTLYATRAFVLGSIDSGIVSPIQQHSWGLTIRSEIDNPVIFSVHPHWSAHELADFFPEEPATLLSQVTGAKPSYADSNKWEGGSPFERTWQDSGRLLVAYDIPSAVPVRCARLYLPVSLDSVIVDSAWMFFREGETVGALHVDSPVERIAAGDAVVVRLCDPHASLLLEVHLVDEAGSLAALRDRLRSTHPDHEALRVQFAARAAAEDPPLPAGMSAPGPSSPEKPSSPEEASSTQEPSHK